MTLIGKDGWPVETIKDRPIINFIRILLHTDIRRTINRAVCAIRGHRYTWGKELPLKRVLTKSPILGMPYDLSKPSLTQAEAQIRFNKMLDAAQPRYYLLCLRCGLKEDGGN